MGAVKKVVDLIKAKKEVKVVKMQEVKVTCLNCDDSGLACSSCTKPFTDTFGE